MQYLPLLNIVRWWESGYKNEAHKILLHAIPIFICQNIWKNRCGATYGGKHSNMTKVKYLVVKDIFFLMQTTFPQVTWPAAWKEIVMLVEKCVHDIKIIHVNWIRPSKLWVNLNSDRSILSDGKMGASGIIKNHNGEFQLAYASPLDIGSNKRAEAKATAFGIVLYIQMGFLNMVLEVDSQLVFRCVNQQASPPCLVDKAMTRLQNHIAQLNSFEYIHIFREANYVADSLAKFSHSLRAPRIFFEVQQILNDTKNHYSFDKINITAFRLKNHLNARWQSLFHDQAPHLGSFCYGLILCQECFVPQFQFQSILIV